MNDVQKLKYDLSVQYASIMLQNDISCGKINPGDTIMMRNRMLSYFSDFADCLTDGTMSKKTVNDLIKYFI